MGLEVGILGFIWAVLIIWAIIKIANSSAEPLPKAIWIVAVLVIQPIGLIVWFFLGPKG